MKKWISIILVLAVVLSCAALIAACNKKNETYEIALITDKGDIDDKSFNQGSWEGVVAYAEANKISHKYYKPEAATDEAYLAAIDLAVTGGAKIIVTPGFLFEVPVYHAQTKYPDVKFILLDGAPHTAADYVTTFPVYDTKANVASVMYEEQQSGFLAGYAAVKDGFRKIGFMGGMAVPAVQAFGYGYLKGADYAAVELGLADDAISAVYHYTGDFAETPVNKNTAATMYTSGTEVIFACGGSVGKSVMSAASESMGKKVIGVDVDQRYDSTTVITSATKGLGASVRAILDAFYKGTFETYGGKTTYFNAANGGVGLPTTVIGDANGNAFDRFTSFTKAQYDVIFNKLVNNEITLPRTITIASTTGEPTEAELETGLSLTKVSVTLKPTPTAQA